jgi:hypothetical protein
MITVQQQIMGRHIWVKRSPEWSAVLDILALPLFRDAERYALIAHIDLDRRTIDWEAVHRTAQVYSQEARTLLRVAHALYNGGDCQLSELESLSSAGRSAAILLIAQRYRE